MDLELGKENLVYTAGQDHTGQVYDCQANRIVASLTGHSKKVTGDQCFRAWQLAKGELAYWKLMHAKNLFFWCGESS